MFLCPTLSWHVAGPLHLRVSALGPYLERCCSPLRLSDCLVLHVCVAVRGPLSDFGESGCSVASHCVPKGFPLVVPPQCMFVPRLFQQRGFCRRSQPVSGGGRGPREGPGYRFPVFSFPPRSHFEWLSLVPYLPAQLCFHSWLLLGFLSCHSRRSQLRQTLDYIGLIVPTRWRGGQEGGVSVGALPSRRGVAVCSLESWGGGELVEAIVLFVC